MVLCVFVCVQSKKKLVPLGIWISTFYDMIMHQFQQFKTIRLGGYQPVQRSYSFINGFESLSTEYVILDAALMFRKVSSTQLAFSKAIITGLSQCRGCQ